MEERCQMSLLTAIVIMAFTAWVTCVFLLIKTHGRRVVAMLLKPLPAPPRAPAPHRSNVQPTHSHTAMVANAVSALLLMAAGEERHSSLLSNVRACNALVTQVL